MKRKIFDREELSKVRKKIIKGIGMVGEICFGRDRDIILCSSREKNTEEEIFVIEILVCVRHAYANSFNVHGTH